ncbi:MAG TPA: phosphotransferase family protein, partial [Pseudomonadales bacterium]|nr:phosphotransferase family protein [Pseudomonadales bacterium]
MGDAGQTAEQKITAWLYAHLGGRVLGIERQTRWRPVWFIDLERDGERLALCVRGERTDMPMVFPLDHEMRFQSLLHGFGIPVARVYGWIDDPRAYVMDRVGGCEDFAAAGGEERRAVVDHYLQILAALHALPLDPFVAA